MRGISLILGLCLLMGCTRVDPGYVGIKVNMYGSQRGVEDFPLHTGRVWYNPFTEEVYPFPTFMQNASWTDHESMTFNSIEGAGVTADVAVAYQLEADKVPVIFVELRQDADYITKIYVRSKVRDALSRHGSTMKVVDIFGSKKEELLKSVKLDLEDELKSRGFKFDMISFIGKLRVDAQVEQSINMTIQATQRAIEAQNKVVQSKAEADQKIEEARGKAQSVLINAKAKAEANDMLTKSSSPQLMEYEALQRWDGVLPKVTGNSIPFIHLPQDAPQKTDSTR